MLRLLLLLSLLSFFMAQRSIAHAQHIVIRDSDFAASRTFTGAGDANLVSTAPMRIVPARIGRPDPTLTRSGYLPPGLLVPRPVETTPAASAVVMDATVTPSLPAH